MSPMRTGRSSQLSSTPPRGIIPKELSKGNNARRGSKHSEGNRQNIDYKNSFQMGYQY